MTAEKIRQALARGYCTDRNSTKILDPDLIEDMAIEIEKIDIDKREEPLLGLATTKMLLDEIRARIEMDGKLNYRTVDIDK